MRSRYAIVILAAAAFLQPLSAATVWSLDRLSYVLTQALERGADPRREPDWSMLQPRLTALLEEDPTGDVAVLAQRAAADVRVRISDPVTRLADPASISIHVDPRFPIDGLTYLVTIETSLDGGAWRPFGWARYPGGGCGSTLTRLFSPSELQPALHRLEVRAHFFILAPRVRREHGGSEPACGFLGPAGTPRPDESQPDPSRSAVLWRESRPVASLSFALSNLPESAIAEVRLAPSSAIPDSYGAAIFELAARNVAVSSLDRRLPDLSLDEWLELTLQPWKTNAAEATTWSVRECRDTTTLKRNRENETWFCAEALAPVNDGKVLAVRLRVGRAVEDSGTSRWLETTPTLDDVYLVQVWNHSLDVARLGDVPAALSIPVENWPTADLELGPAGITMEGPERVPVAGDVVTIVFRVHNHGRRDADNALLKARLFPSGDRDRAVDHDVRLDVPAGGTAVTTWTVELPPAADWSVGALVEQDYIGSKPAPLEADLNNTAMFELGAVPADRARQLEEWRALLRAQPAR